MANEFEELDMEEMVPEQTFSPTPQDDDIIIDSGVGGVVYDYTKAPTRTRAPEREILDGKEVIIESTDIILPPTESSWKKTRAGDKDVKYCTFELTYSIGGQKEFYSGVRVFKRTKDGKEGYSHPTITPDRSNQASELMGKYADYKQKDIRQVSLSEFLAFLKSKPKAIIESVDVENPVTKQKIKKNLVAKFIN